MSSSEPTDAVARLLNIEHRVFNADSEKAAHYAMVNQTRTLVDCAQCVLLGFSGGGRARVLAISNLSEVDRTSPFVNWLEALVDDRIAATRGDLKPQRVSAADVPESLRSEWVSYCLPHIALQPLQAGWRGRQGVLMLARQTAFSDQEILNLQHLAHTYGFALAAKGKPVLRPRRWRAVAWLAGALMLAALFIPYHLSVLAPASIEPRAPFPVTAAIQGQVEAIAVAPNAVVRQGDVVATLVSGALTAELNVRKKAVDLAQATLDRAIQSGLRDRDSRASVPGLDAELALARVELKRAEYQASELVLRAPVAGVVVIEDPSGWRGRPVVPGDELMRIADTDKVQIVAQVAVADAIGLEPGRAVRLFLDTAPLDPIDAVIEYATFQPRQSGNDVPAYKVVAGLSPQQPVPRLGLRGTVRLSGEPVSLGYYLFRRPITAARQWLGW